MGRALSWTPWSPVPGLEDWNGSGVRETLLGGQAFRWREESPGEYLGFWDRYAVRLRMALAGAGVEYARPVPLKVGADEVARYLGAGQPWAAFRDRLPWRSDSFLEAAMRAFPGLQLLQQSPEETLLSFLCSSNKQIVQIVQICEALAERIGQPLWPGASWHRLPTWEELAGAPEEELLRCRMGYRARHVAGCARFLSDHPRFLEEVAALPTTEAKAALQGLPGVGPKVAECVLLFGYQRLDAFPVDTWILKVLEREYGLTGWSRGQMEHFARIHFGEATGYAQQFLFAMARLGSKEKKNEEAYRR